MSEHRYPCQTLAPDLAGWTNADLAVSGHQHACIHGALDRPKRPVVEHACVCGMTWTEQVETPKPYEIQMTTVESGKGILLGLVVTVAVVCAVSGLIVWATS